MDEPMSFQNTLADNLNNMKFNPLPSQGLNEEPMFK